MDLRKAGLKATLPRGRILEALETSTARHLSAEDVYRLMMEAGEEVEGAGSLLTLALEQNIHTHTCTNGI